MIIDFEEYMSSKKFDEVVFPLLMSTQTPFSFTTEGFESLIFLEKKPPFFLFLTYIPNGHHTHLPTLEDSLQNRIGKPRLSKGEWVVDTIFQTNAEEANRIFRQIEQKQIQNNIISFIRNEIYKS